jgi:hypothetical protein
VAEVEEAAPAGMGAGEEQPSGALLRPSVSWLRVIEVALLAALALILPATIIAVIQRYKSQ